MILAPRTALIRNLFVSGTSGALTLIILLIAPLGLVAVVINTTLVMLATFTTSQAADRVIHFLQSDRSPKDSHSIQILPEDEPGHLKQRS